MNTYRCHMPDHDLITDAHQLDAESAQLAAIAYFSRRWKNAEDWDSGIVEVECIEGEDHSPARWDVHVFSVPQFAAVPA